MSVYDLVEKVRVRPGMYLGTLSVTALMHFINGYRFAEREAKAKSGERGGNELFPLEFFPYFAEYTKIRLGFSSSTAGWRNHLIETCGGDEEKALDMFFELFDEFARIRPKRCWKAVLSEENAAFNNEMRRCARIVGINPEEKEPVFTDPIAVYITELDIPVTDKSAFLLSVETAHGVEHQWTFYESFEQAARNSCIPESAETYFGKIENWREHNN